MLGYKKYYITVEATFLGVHEPTIDIFTVSVNAKCSDDALEKVRNKWVKWLFKRDCIEFTLKYADLSVYKTLKITGGGYSIKAVNIKNW